MGGSFVGNSANWGGGLASFYTTTVSGTTFSGNKALLNGGAVHYARVGGGALTLQYSLLTANEAAESGGAVQLSDGSISIYRSTLAGNTASYNGGGINTFGDTYVNMVEVTISGNRAYYGGGLRAFYSVVYIYDSTFSGNTGVGFGGGIHQEDCCGLYLTSVTLSGNNTSGLGGGLSTNAESPVPVLRNVTFFDNSALRGGAIRAVNGVVMTNTIVANSRSGGNCLGSVLASKYSLSSDNTCALTGPGSQNAVDPQLSGLGNYGGPTQTHLPAAGSPVVDAIVGQDAPPWDQRHVIRPQGLGHDIGSVERRPSDTAIVPRLYLPLLRR